MIWVLIGLAVGVGGAAMWDVWVVRARKPFKRPRMKYF